MSTLSFHSPQRPTRSSIKALFDFLTDFRNFPRVLPVERISDFQLTDTGCSFSIKGVAALKVNLEKKQPYNEIVYHLTGPARSELHLRVLFTGDAGQPGTSEVHMEARLNPFLKAMAEKPLRALADTVAEKLAELNTEDYEN